MSAYKKSIRYRLSYIILILLLCIVGSVGVFCYQLSIHIDEMSRYESKLLATRIINSAVEKVLKDLPVQELVSEVRDNNGQIVSLSLDSKKTNAINNLISETVTKKLKECEDEGFKVPIGTLSGINFLNGRGFDVELRLHQLGAVSTQFLSEFESCGINQSKYRVYIQIKVELSAVMAVKTTDITVDYQYLIGEKVVVGAVPNTYFSV